MKQRVPDLPDSTTLRQLRDAPSRRLTESAQEQEYVSLI